MRFPRSYLLILLLAPLSANAQTWHTLLKRADQLRQNGQNDSAIVVARQALDEAERDCGKENAGYADALRMAGLIQYDRGRYSEAESHWTSALRIRENALGPNHPDVAESLADLGELYFDQARLAEAESAYTRSLDIRTRTLAPDDLNLAFSLFALAALYGEEGRDADSKAMLDRGIPLLQDAAKRAGIPVAIGMMMGMISPYSLENHYEQAEGIYAQALAEMEKMLGRDHPLTNFTRERLAEIYTAERQYDKAEPLYRHTLAVWELVDGADHTDVAATLRSLAELRLHQGRYAEADSLDRRALAVYEQNWGAMHPEVAGVLSDLALARSRQGNHAAAHDFALRAWEIRRRNFRDGANVLAERNALQYSRFFNQETGNCLSVLLDSPDALLTRRSEIARTVLSAKSVVTDEMMRRRRTLEWATSPDLIGVADSLKWARFAVSHLYVTGPGDEEEPDEFKAKLQSALAEKERLEAELARRSIAFAQQQTLWDVDESDIAAALPPGAALVEYLKYDHRLSIDSAETRYLAIVVRKERETQVFPLGPAAAIDTAVWYYRQHFARTEALDRNAYRAVSDYVYDLVWRPLSSSLDRANLVFVAADGNLNLVSFAGLITGDGKYLIEKYPIHYLSTGRDLIRLQEKTGSGAGLLAMGDPDFDLAPQEDKPASAVMGAILSVMNLRSSCTALNELTVARLSSTRREIMSVADQWSKNRAEPVITCLDTSATEDNLKRFAYGKRVVHIATHGFYFPGACRPKGHSEKYIGENPLLQSGLLLAGANRHGGGAADAHREDGIVTAEEVAGIDLSGTDLVVLSACETGLGEVKSGEGVFGLRRAFQMAGAKTVISALWQVDDQATAAYMSRLAAAKGSLPVIMRQTALERIAERRAAGTSDHPFYWAGFVATGDWQW